jgi:hypothetical protein
LPTRCAARSCSRCCCSARTRGELGSRFGLHRGLLLGVERVAFAFPLHFDAGAVILDVAGRVAVQVAHVEARLLALLVALDLDAVLPAVHDWVLAVGNASHAAQRVGKLLLGRHGWPRHCHVGVAFT